MQAVRLYMSICFSKCLRPPSPRASLTHTKYTFPGPIKMRRQINRVVRKFVRKLKDRAEKSGHVDLEVRISGIELPSLREQN